ncbi:hypothetical protein PV08_10174 [Exophiala spinifera]|uniref:DUF7908 domain-containing protein n=1 Tax=Exophiala spinifera TaxID=91928 RepID=A0A0D2AWM4_9EURO|nr:uncharacterized protein PV08_10174 [Exophiala spinifera]KIW10875.1 hypothetical protein PV08_10174 [Exophiala spinifera]
MIWRLITSVAIVANLVRPIIGYGTTVFVEVSYCPATHMTSTLATRTTSSTSSSAPSFTPIVLTVVQVFDEQPQYVSADGTLTNDSSLAVDFSINPIGQLEGAGGFISTDGNETSKPFEVSPTPGTISTFFSLTSNDTVARRDGAPASKTLVWKNDAFVGGEAMFCVFGSILEAAFGGTLPPGCLEVILGAIPTSDVRPSSTSSSTTTLSPSSTRAGSSSLTDSATTSYSLVPTSNSPSLSPTPEPTPGSTTSQTSAQYLSTSSPEHRSSSTNAEMISSMTFTQGAETSLSTTSSYSSTISYTSSLTLSEYPAPTTTGTPNCFDRSPFDGTVNNDYLVLCDTYLPGFDLQQVPASNIAECIDQCNSYIPTSQGPCVAIAFDILASVNPCTLKYNISEVSRGADAFSQAAILVNQPFSPEIVFSDTASSSSSSTGEGISSTRPPPDTTSNPSSIATTPPASTTAPTIIGTVSTSAAAQQPSSSTTTQVLQTSPGIGSSFTSLPTSASSSTTRLSTLPIPTSSPITSPVTSQQRTSASATTIGQQQSSSTLSTSRNPSSSSTSPSSPPSTTTSRVVSSVVSSVSTSQMTPTSSGSQPPSSSSSLVFSTVAIVATSSTSLPASSQVTTSPVTPVATTFLPSSVSISTTPPHCSATPTTTSLCPAYDHQALNVNGDGSCYEVECSTTLQGGILTGNSTTASTLTTCISFCTLYNVAIPYGCVGVNFLGSLSGSNPNCILMSSVSSTTFGSGIDSARLLYPGYPAINDPHYLGTTTTTTTTPNAGTFTTRASSSSLTSLVGVGSTTSTIGLGTSGVTSGNSQTTTTIAGGGTPTTRTTTTFVQPSCPAAPTANSCPAPSGSPVPYCYSYTNYGNTAPFEVECATSFTGASMQPLLAFGFEDCVSWCQYANILVPNSCVGLTYRNGTVSQGGSNNCFRYATLTCATRGNATFASARLIWAGYPAMTDYGGNFGC